MSRSLQATVLGLVALAVSMSSDQAQAQSVRFGIGLGNGVRIGVGNGPMYGPGYYGRGYGPGYYGPGYGSGYGPGYYRPGLGYGYAPAPVVISPRPVYVPQPVYAQPQYGAAPTSLPDGGEIMLFNPGSSQVEVRYTLNGQLYTLPPGTKQSLTNDRTWSVQFESAPGQVTTYTLKSARYKFKSTQTGLGLFQTQDNPEVAQPSGLPAAPVPSPPAPDPETTVIPSRPALKRAP